MRSQEVRTRRGAPGDARASVSLACPRAHRESASRSKCIKISAPARASAGALGAHRAHLPGPAGGTRARRRRRLGRGAGPPPRGSLSANRPGTEGGLGRRPASPTLGACGQPERPRRGARPGFGGRPRAGGRRPRAIWTPSAGAFEVVRGLFVRQAALARGLEVVYGLDAFEPIPSPGLQDVILWGVRGKRAAALPARSLLRFPLVASPWGGIADSTVFSSRFSIKD
ncbi:hypothetical protein R6Z07F_000050 [Ovis aries]